MTDAKEQKLLDRISELLAENASLRAHIVKLEQQLVELTASPPPSPGGRPPIS